MTLRGNLFIKMFIAFWLMTILVLGSWLLATNYFETQPAIMEYADQRAAVPPHGFLLRTIYNLENLDDAALANAVDEVRRSNGIQIFLLDQSGADLLGRKVPRAVRRAADALHNGRRRAIVKTAQQQLVAQSIYRPQQGVVSAVFVFTPQRGYLLNVLGSNLWLRIGLAVAISGTVCFGLSRLLTQRLKELQLAARRLAGGDLDARLQVRRRGGDETDELARDFNSMAEQLQERIQSQKRLLGDVSHELRSPLARLRIALALAQDKPAEGAKYMQRIEQETERLEELIRQLLSSQAQDIVLDTHIDLVPLLQQLCVDANFEGQGSGKQFLFNTDIERAIVVSSLDLLHKSVDNILRNALQHTAETSVVEVSLASTQDHYLITIEDHGPGVPEEDLDNIFTEFYRVDSARTRESGGYGLGLAIARRAIRQHGGEITAHNTGTGLRIVMQLPAPQL
jgi:signal transduction histidine kinase